MKSNVANSPKLQLIISWGVNGLVVQNSEKSVVFITA